jgi:hypothetical protein
LFFLTFLLDSFANGLWAVECETRDLVFGADWPGSVTLTTIDSARVDVLSPFRHAKAWRRHGGVQLLHGDLALQKVAKV